MNTTIVKYIANNTSQLFLLGGGLCYVIEEKKYTHIPVVFLFPSIYCGYNIYKNRNIFLDRNNIFKKHT